MYRAVIKLPEWMPDELRKRLDLSDGDDRDRIYRIVAKDDSECSPDPTTLPQLSFATNEQLVSMLMDPNSWRRDTAARLLLERRDRTVGELLRTLVHNASLAAALNVLSMLNLMLPKDVRTVIDDSDTRVRHKRSC